MTVSILLPVFNVAAYLPQCVESLLAQTYRAIEVIAVDDGSTDGSLDILRSYAARDPRFRVLAQNNGGSARARNAGLAYVRGEYLMFCDADDWYAPSMCAHMVKVAMREDADLVMCAAAIHDEVKNVITANQQQYAVNPYTGRCVVDDALRAGINAVLWNKLFRTAIVRRFSVTFPDGYEHEDISFVHQYLGVARIYAGLSEPLYHHRLRAGSVMALFYHGGAPEKKFDILYAFRHTGRFFRANELWDMRRLWFLRSFQSALLYLWRFLRQEEKVWALAAVSSILGEFGADWRAAPRLLAWIGGGHCRRARLYLDGLCGAYRIFGGMVDICFPRGSRRRRILCQWL